MQYLSQSPTFANEIGLNQQIPLALSDWYRVDFAHRGSAGPEEVQGDRLLWLKITSSFPKVGFPATWDAHYSELAGTQALVAKSGTGVGFTLQLEDLP